MSLLWLVAVAAVMSGAIIVLALRLAPWIGLMDVPDPRIVQQVHTRATPRVGGLGIAFATLVTVLWVLPLNPLLESYAVGAVVVYAFGLWDDVRRIEHQHKIIGQLLAVTIVVIHGDLWIDRMPYYGEVPAWFGKSFTVFAIVGAINATNHSDGLDGLAGGQSVLSLATLACLAWAAGGDQFSVTIAVVAMAATLAFLAFNHHPARVFMGDVGSQFLGFTLGVLAVHLTQVVDRSLSAALPLLILGLPVFDILAVLAQRICGGMNWFLATRNHLHHRLLDLGLSHRGAVRLLYATQALLVVSALWLRNASDWLVTGWYLLVCGALLAGVYIVERRNGIDAHRYIERRRESRRRHSLHQDT